MRIPSHQQPSWGSGGDAAGLPMQENHYDYSRVAQHALVLGPSGHVQPDLNLPYLLTQPFNQTPHIHRNHTNLSLHAWLLETQQSKNRASMRQWQHELRLQPDQSVRQSGPFYKVVPQ